jgi:hypothetical protein
VLLDTFTAQPSSESLEIKELPRRSVLTSLDQGMNAKTKLEFKVLVYRDLDFDRTPIYIAQCVNYDLASHGESVAAVLNSLQRLIQTQIKLSLDDGIEPFSDFEAAPPEFWARYSTPKIREETAFRFDKRPVAGVGFMKLAA